MVQHTTDDEIATNSEAYKVLVAFVAVIGF